MPREQRPAAGDAHAALDDRAGIPPRRHGRTHQATHAGDHQALVDEVLAVTKRAHVSKMGFVGNEYYMNIF